MATDIKPRIRIPAKVKKGEVFEVKTLVTHIMESGQRKNAAGETIPRQIINRMTVTYGGRTVFTAKLDPAISANPYIGFFVKADRSGPLDFVWKDDDGSEYKFSQPVTVEG